ncbi:MAG: IS630 family transposase [Bacteroidales bacterium]
MVKKYAVDLSKEEQALLNELITSRTQRVRKTNHARILLKADAGWTDEAIAEALNVSIPTIQRVRQRFVELNFEQALNPSHSRRKYQCLLDGVQEAHLIALACSTPPKGYHRWSLRLLDNKMVQLEYVNELSYETERQVLVENELKPWLREEWCIPPKENAQFVYRMEDVLDVYLRSFDPRFPLVCFDEKPVQQLVRETRKAIPMQIGQPERWDYEYHREGTADLFMFFAPLHNWRHVEVTAHRTKEDWAKCMHDLVYVYFPKAERCVLVEDNLNTHDPSALYEVFPPTQAKSILDRLEFHFSPKHGSWLNMAIECVEPPCLDRYISSPAMLFEETNAWEIDRNTNGATVDWRSTTADARIKLKKLYPTICLIRNVKEPQHIKA